MAAVALESDSPQAEQIQQAAQARLIEIGWVSDESDTTLSEYVTMMLVNGKEAREVQTELGGELLGVGEDDETVASFTAWIFEQARALVDGAKPTVGDTLDERMTDAAITEEPCVPPLGASDLNMLTRSSPKGPRAMRNGDGSGGRGRAGRMIGHTKDHTDRSEDPLRRIQSTASATGRIDTHRPPRGPRSMMRGRGGPNGPNGHGGHGGHGMQMMPNQMLDPASQMAFMQMMEMQASMVANALQQGGRGRGRGRGGRGSFGGRGGHGQQNGDAQSNAGPDLDKPLTDTAAAKPPFDIMCKFNLFCQNPDCPYAHQSPANRRPNATLDMADTCTYGIACQNNKCLARHPSPAQRQSYKRSEVQCKFFPNCSAGPACPFKHPDVRPCRYGADCKVEGCPFAHSQIVCRYHPCKRADCPYKHAENQKGTFEDKVWIAGGEPRDEPSGTANRFQELKNTEGNAEELVLPGSDEMA
ncbi:hypothetical protein K470DRAFT_219136 [Piedraia hortae CBS 480.64]|uniref:C3H1-type domain-containing protein n=1 Tax=Piedraia hortae CBS 480.64 TaxID=1314780 RepID=A0A6A7BY78_9PEZI|nr:hypothetical protein K470DRAFT_219136 [Piedraia hortae CBS 480.64]